MNFASAKVSACGERTCTAHTHLHGSPLRLRGGRGNLLRGSGRAGVPLYTYIYYGFEEARSYYRHLMDHLQWKDLGQVLAGGNMDTGDIQGKAELRQAYDRGRSIS